MDNIEKENAVEQIIEDFGEIQDLQNQLTVRVAKRVTLIYRMFFISFGLILGAFFFMVFIMSTQMKHMTLAITTMNTHFTQMNNDMDLMLHSMAGMDRNVKSMPKIVTHINTMYQNVDSMSADMSGIYQDMDTMTTDMQRLKTNVTDMKKSFRTLDSNVARMNKDVNHMASPMRMFNNFNPMN